MAGYYTIQQGDYLSKIASINGFANYHTIWDHPNNAALKKKRQDPNVLFPGDKLFIPEKEERKESSITGKRHTFVVTKQSLKLRLVLEDCYEKPIANAPCTLMVDGEARQVTTDASGKIEQQIPATLKEAFLIINDEQTPFENDAIPIKVGHLDPVEEISGQIARLNNLGYFAGDVNPAQQTAGDGGSNDDGKDCNGDRKNDDEFRSAVEEFQCDHGLQVDGKCGPITQAKLKKVHGC